MATGQGGSIISTDFIGFSAFPNISTLSFEFIFCLLGTAYAGVNRFTLVALVAAFFNVIGVVAEFYCWTAEADGTARSNAANVLFTYVGYYTGDTVIVLYGYFIVERLLPKYSRKGGWLISRRMFMWIFWTLQAGHIVSRVAAIIAVLVYFCELPRDLRNASPPSIFDYTLAQFVILTAIELFTAYFLIVIFRRSRKVDVRYLGGKRLPLLKHMLLSTELRVASMSVLYLFRAATEKGRQLHNPTAQRIDRIVVPFLGLFPMLLILDCVVRKALGIEVEYQARNDRCTCLMVNNVELGGVKPAERVHSDVRENSGEISSSSQSAGHFH